MPNDFQLKTLKLTTNCKEIKIINVLFVFWFDHIFSQNNYSKVLEVNIQWTFNFGGGGAGFQLVSPFPDEWMNEWIVYFLLKHETFIMKNNLLIHNVCINDYNEHIIDVSVTLMQCFRLVVILHLLLRKNGQQRCFMPGKWYNFSYFPNGQTLVLYLSILFFLLHQCCKPRILEDSTDNCIIELTIAL